MTTSLHPQPSQINYARRDVVVETLALDLRLKTTSAHQLLYGRDALNHRTATAIKAFQRHGALDRLSHWAAPIREVLAAIGPVALTTDLILDAQLVDLDEDADEARYHAAPTDENARKWVAKIDRLIGYLLRLRAGLVAKHNLERQ